MEAILEEDEQETPKEQATKSAETADEKDKEYEFDDSRLDEILE